MMEPRQAAAHQERDEAGERRGQHADLEGHEQEHGPGIERPSADVDRVVDHRAVPLQPKAKAAMPKPAMSMAQADARRLDVENPSISAKGKGVSASSVRCPSRADAARRPQQGVGVAEFGQQRPDHDSALPAAEGADLVHRHGRNQADEAQEQEREEARAARTAAASPRASGRTAAT